METAEVVIVGGGIVGSSIAYHLAAAGCRDVARAGARIRDRQRIDRQKHGRRAGAVFDAGQYPDVAVLDPLLCQL